MCAEGWLLLHKGSTHTANSTLSLSDPSQSHTDTNIRKHLLFEVKKEEVNPILFAEKAQEQTQIFYTYPKEKD